MDETLERLGIEEENPGTFFGSWSGDGEPFESFSPIDGELIGRVTQTTETEFERVMQRSGEAFASWSALPAPKRGQVIRQLGDALREMAEPLGYLITYEMGKIIPESVGEVQEVIDICDFAVGLSRQLYGLAMHSERPGHRMYEQWHPLGRVGVVTAFNFPVAVWGWNAAISAVCGNATIWKPSEKTPLTAIACTKIAARVCEENDVDPAIFSLINGDAEAIGERFVSDTRIPLISATGSCPMGRRVGQVVGGRLGRTILELGGNNAVVVTPSADLDLVVRAIVFGAVGTAGQRCTTTRRLIVHSSIRDELVERLIRAYEQVIVGDPRESYTLMGPLIDVEAHQNMQDALQALTEQGGEILWGGTPLRLDDFYPPTYVEPCLAAARNDMEIVQQETFAPILYVIPYETLDEAIRVHNDVPQGLSSAIFTTDLREAETFLSHVGSDCGIANVNVGTSGAEIGGAFGGEKDTGGGREAGSDAWKAYMRRQTTTINFSNDLPLAQGIEFGD